MGKNPMLPSVLVEVYWNMRKICVEVHFEQLSNEEPQTLMQLRSLMKYERQFALWVRRVQDGDTALLASTDDISKHEL